jgi:molecular chaperone DnaJ
MPAGVKDGQKVRLRGQGKASFTGGDPGDLVVVVHVEPDSVFHLDGEDIRITLPVTFVEAALGATVEVPTATGATVKLKIAPGTSSGTVLRVKGRGVKTQQRTGDQLVVVQVVVPQRIDAAARKALDALAEALADTPDPRAELLARTKVGGP